MVHMSCHALCQPAESARQILSDSLAGQIADVAMAAKLIKLQFNVICRVEISRFVQNLGVVRAASQRVEAVGHGGQRGVHGLLFIIIHQLLSAASWFDSLSRIEILLSPFLLWNNFGRLGHAQVHSIHAAERSSHSTHIWDADELSSGLSISIVGSLVACIVGAADHRRADSAT